MDLTYLTNLSIPSQLGSGTNVVNIAGGVLTQARLILWPSGENGQPTPNELWYLQQAYPDLGSNEFWIVSNLSGMVIDVPGGSTEPGTQLQVFPMNQPPSNNQLWTAVASPAGGWPIAIQSMLSQDPTQSPLVFNVAGGNTNPDTPLITWPAPGNWSADNLAPTPNELWDFTLTNINPPFTQFFITALEVPDPAGINQNFTRFRGLDFQAVDGEITVQYECSADTGGSGIYMVTTSPGTVFTLGQSWRDNGFAITNSSGQNISGNPADSSTSVTINVAGATPL